MGLQNQKSGAQNNSGCIDPSLIQSPAFDEMSSNNSVTSDLDVDYEVDRAPKRRRKNTNASAHSSDPIDFNTLTLENIDQVIKKAEAQWGPNSRIVKELKDHKRKLRNRQSATASRQRQRQTGLVLFNEIRKQVVIINSTTALIALWRYRHDKRAERIRELEEDVVRLSSANSGNPSPDNCSGCAGPVLVADAHCVEDRNKEADFH